MGIADNIIPSPHLQGKCLCFDVDEFMLFIVIKKAYSAVSESTVRFKWQSCGTVSIKGNEAAEYNRHRNLIIAVNTIAQLGAPIGYLREVGLLWLKTQSNPDSDKVASNMR